MRDTAAVAAPDPAHAERLRKAGAQLQQGRIAEAAALLEALLEALPGEPDALHLLGLARFRQGEHDEAIALLRQAVETVPGFAGYRVNLGNLLFAARRFGEARDEFLAALALDPGNPDAWSNLGSARARLGEQAPAIEAFERALSLAPEHAEAHAGLAAIFEPLDPSRARRHRCQALISRGTRHYQRGEIEQAAEMFRQWVVLAPDDPIARHHYAACSGREVPERASDAYLSRSFDLYAASFDGTLQQDLHYRVPQLLRERLAAQLPAPAARFDVLDAGCGTGLCGPLLAGWARTLTGVDLSAGMLARAHERGSYDRLEQCELGAHLRAHPDRYDLIVAADTLCYFGPLGSILAAAAAALRAGGWLAFSLEALDADESGAPGFALAPSGRYRHTAAHVAAGLAAAGLRRPEIAGAHLRNEFGRPVEGWIVSACREP